MPPWRMAWYFLCLTQQPEHHETKAAKNQPVVQFPSRWRREQAALQEPRHPECVKPLKSAKRLNWNPELSWGPTWANKSEFKAGFISWRQAQMRECVCSLLKAQSERLIHCWDAVWGNSCNPDHFAARCVWKMGNTLGVCSADSYQQCSRSVCFSGFLRIHHSNLPICVLNSLGSGCCESMAEVHCSLSGSLLFPVQRLSPGLGLVCINQCFAGVWEALPSLGSLEGWAQSAALGAPWSTGKKLKQILIPGKHSSDLSAWWLQVHKGKLQRRVPGSDFWWCQLSAL